MFGFVDSIRADLNDADAVALALWFHDAVYDPQAKDNDLKVLSYSSSIWLKIYQLISFKR
jgi:predicted metal-dependent HD superfamily phosphohydrolase